MYNISLNGKDTGMKASATQVVKLVYTLGLRKRVIMRMTKNSGVESYYDANINNFVAPKKLQNVAGMSLAQQNMIAIQLEEWGDKADYLRNLGYIVFGITAIAANQDQRS